MTTKRTFKHSAAPVDASAFIEAAPYASGSVAVKTTDEAEGQLHVLMPKSSIVALKRAALDRGTTVSNLVRDAVRVYITT